MPAPAVPSVPRSLWCQSNIVYSAECPRLTGRERITALPSGQALSRFPRQSFRVRTRSGADSCSPTGTKTGVTPSKRNSLAPVSLRATGPRPGVTWVLVAFASPVAQVNAGPFLSIAPGRSA